MKCETPPKPFPGSENCPISPAAHRNAAVPKKLPELPTFISQRKQDSHSDTHSPSISPRPNPKHAANNGHVGTSKSIAACSKHPWSLQSGRTASYTSPRLSPGSGAETAGPQREIPRRAATLLSLACAVSHAASSRAAASRGSAWRPAARLSHAAAVPPLCHRCASQARNQQSRGSNRSRRARVSSSR